MVPSPIVLAFILHRNMTKRMPCTVVVGGFYGDEGKGKILAYMSLKDSPKIAVRGGVGANAGHTFVHQNNKYKVRMLPSAILNQATKLLVGPGVLLTPNILTAEIEKYSTSGRTFVDRQCGIIEEQHVELDGQSVHLKNVIGSTGTGTGPANADRAIRILKLAKDVPMLDQYLSDVSQMVNESIEDGSHVVVEGTQGTYLSLFHGTYPFVTSKDVTASGICSDVGIGPKRVDDVLVVFKSYVTRVGGGPLPNELSSDEAVLKGWTEYGSVTGRLRRTSSFNMDLAKRAVVLNSATQLAITKMDVLFPSCAGTRDFSKLTIDAKKFILNIEEETGVPVVLIGTGQEVYDVIDLRRN
jgi:adenylosuccinate synthase